MPQDDRLPGETWKQRNHRKWAERQEAKRQEALRERRIAQQQVHEVEHGAQVGAVQAQPVQQRAGTVHYERDVSPHYAEVTPYETAHTRDVQAGNAYAPPPVIHYVPGRQRFPWKRTLLLLIFLAGVAVYYYPEQLTSRIAETEPYITSYVAWVDQQIEWVRGLFVI